MKKITIVIITMLIMLLPAVPAQAECVQNADGTYTYEGTLDLIYATQLFDAYPDFNTSSKTVYVIEEMTGDYLFTTESPVAFYWNKTATGYNDGLMLIYKSNGNYVNTSIFPVINGQTKSYQATCNKGGYVVYTWVSSVGLTGLPMNNSARCIDNPYYKKKTPVQEDFDEDVLFYVTCLNYFGVEKWVNGKINNLDFPIFDSYEHAKAYIDIGSNDGLLNSKDMHDSDLQLPTNVNLIETDAVNHEYQFTVEYPEASNYFGYGMYVFIVEYNGDMYSTSPRALDDAAVPVDSSTNSIVFDLNAYSLTLDYPFAMGLGDRTHGGAGSSFGDEETDEETKETFENVADIVLHYSNIVMGDWATDKLLSDIYIDPNSEGALSLINVWDNVT